MQPISSTSHLSIFSRAFILLLTVLVITSLTVSTVYAFDTGFSSPGSASTPGKSWTNVSYSLASDNLYATAKRVNKQLRLSRFTIPGVPGGAAITGIEVTVEGYTTGLQANVALSYNNGLSYTSAFTTALTGADTTVTLGGPTNTWGRAWTSSEFTDSNFIVKLTTTGAGGPIYVDQVQVKVHYTSPITTLNLSPVSGSYGGTTSMTATLTLTDGGGPIADRTISFFLGGIGLDANGNCTGNPVGTTNTNESGVATLSSASLSGISAGSYPYGACAKFAGDNIYQATAITNSLTVSGTTTNLVVSPSSGVYGGTVDLTATLTSNGLPVSGEWINFSLFGNTLSGSAKTDPQGVATLANQSIVGYNTGSSNDIGASFAGNANLSPASGTAVITIDPRPLEVTAVRDTKAYDGTTSSATDPRISSGSLVTGDTASFTQTFDNKEVGTGKTLTPSGVVSDDNSGLNYTVTFVPVNTGVINKATLTVTAANKFKFVGQPDPAFTFSYSGFVAGETSAVLTTLPTCTVSVVHTAAGLYPITCSGGVDDSYAFNYVNGTLTVSNGTFADVPTTYPVWSYIERLYAAGITGGCTTTPPLNYCPENTVNRAQMAIFLLRGIHGSSYVPPAVNGDSGFLDVPANSSFAPWIKELAAEGITGGCGNGNYCPTAPVSRVAMAIFLLRAEHGSSYTPPDVGTSTGFADVPPDYPNAAWIKQLVAENITAGCGGGNYCPTNPVTRAQMAVFLVRAFNLPELP